MNIIRNLVPLAMALFTSTVVLADDIPSTPNHPAWHAECASCHVAYPPALLTAAGWRTVMSGLDKHFGSDASLDDKTRADITAFLVRHAGRSPRLASQGGRLTETAWFRHEHDEVPAQVWRSSVKSPAECQACHTGADKGSFREREIRMPSAQTSR